MPPAVAPLHVDRAFRFAPAAILVCALVVTHVGTAAAQPVTPADPRGSRPPTLSVGVEFRERMEATANAGTSPGRDDVFWLSRLRVSVTGRPTSWATMTAQLQDARVAHKDIGPTGTPFSAPLDVRIAQVALGRSTSQVSGTFGRQELAFGEQRLVGPVGWANAARTFDAARVTLRQSGLRVDGFLASVVRVRRTDWDRGGFGNQFHGVYASTTRVIPAATVEPYFLWRADRDQRTDAGTFTPRHLGTTGVRVAGTLHGTFEYGIESVVQRGSRGHEVERAYAQHLRLRLPALTRGVRIVTEYNYASGDRTPGDGRHGTFDPLYPTPHDKYGLADQVGWRNVHHARAAVEITRYAQLPIAAAYHSWWLASRTDALYTAGGAVAAQIPDGAPGRHVGQELDLQASHPFTSHVQVAGGYACLFPGTFLRAATPGARMHAAFLMLTIAATTGR
ncbi:MAG: hypothetical protein ABS36_18830 [Acidobacteria bacterium SCN 69-37]|nr:MAG: hypothetical protein ABS36_18830 [Acidobacteria bacterium SCN 69-37]